MQHSALINVMVSAAEKASRGLLRDFGELEQLQTSRKGTAGFVGRSERKCKLVLAEMLIKARPDCALLVGDQKVPPSTTPAEGSDRFIIQPISGMVNFAHSVPHFAISIAAEQNGEIKAGLVFDPLRDERFWVEYGESAWLNNQRLRVSQRSTLRDAILALGGTSSHADLPHRGYAVRALGAAALDLAWLAAGRYDGFWAKGLDICDHAASTLLVREAGGMIQMNANQLLAANSALYDSFRELARL